MVGVSGFGLEVRVVIMDFPGIAGLHTKASS